MVSSANPLATRTGLEILEEGGNAFDATVAVAAALNVVEPMMSGIGGYGGIMVYDADEEQTRFLHASSKMPAALDPKAFRPPTQNYVQNRRGAKAISTPGNANAWEALSRDYGELEWRRLFEPAIGLAEEGFPIGEITAGWISSEFPAFPQHARNIYGTNGVPLRAGETLVQEDLARSLRLIAEGGAGVVYEGELGEAIDATVRENGGFLTLEDLRDNRAEWREPTSIDYRGYEVVTSSPPATSWGTLVRLGVMGELGPTSLGHNSAEYLHVYAEVTKRAYSQRIEYSRDPDISPTPLDRLLSEDFWAEEAPQVGPLRAAYQPPTTFTSLSNTREHTTHFVEPDVLAVDGSLPESVRNELSARGHNVQVDQHWLGNAHGVTVEYDPEGEPVRFTGGSDPRGEGVAAGA